jgi:hypothetical protein
MRFFVPQARDDAEAERLWAAVRGDLLDRGLPTTCRRIRALSLHPDCERLVEVGKDTPDDGPVMIILEASNLDLFYVCTPLRGALEGPPYALGLDALGYAIDFDEEAAGHA